MIGTSGLTDGIGGTGDLLKGGTLGSGLYNGNENAEEHCGKQYASCI